LTPQAIPSTTSPVRPISTMMKEELYLQHSTAAQPTHPTAKERKKGRNTVQQTPRSREPTQHNITQTTIRNKLFFTEQRQTGGTP
jgi:hypothetical protein